MTRSARGRHLLLVEDDGGLRHLTAHRLRLLGHEETLAENGEQALTLTVDQGRTFDMVLMDVQMPVQDGLEILRQLRTHLRTRDLPILVISGTGVAEGMRAGGDRFLVKPYGKKQLADAIEQTLKMRAHFPGSDDA